MRAAEARGCRRRVRRAVRNIHIIISTVSYLSCRFLYMITILRLSVRSQLMFHGRITISTRSLSCPLKSVPRVCRDWRNVPIIAPLSAS